MKGGVETRDLGQHGIVPPDRFDQLDLARQVIRVERADPAQFLDQFHRDTLGLVVAIPAMDDAVADDRDGRESDRAVEPFDHQARGRLLVQGIDRVILNAGAIAVRDEQSGTRKPDPLDPTGE